MRQYLALVNRHGTVVLLAFPDLLTFQWQLPFNQPIIQPTNQSTNQPINQPTNQLNQPIQLTDKQTN